MLLSLKNALYSFYHSVSCDCFVQLLYLEMCYISLIFPCLYIHQVLPRVVVAYKDLQKISHSSSARTKSMNKQTCKIKVQKIGFSWSYRVWGRCFRWSSVHFHPGIWVDEFFHLTYLASKAIDWKKNIICVAIYYKEIHYNLIEKFVVGLYAAIQIA